MRKHIFDFTEIGEKFRILQIFIFCGVFVCKLNLEAIASKKTNILILALVEVNERTIFWGKSFL